MGNVDYEWTGGAPDQGLPFPTPQSSPNAARDIKYLAEHIYIDADDSNLPTFTNTGPPLHFYGEGRPDAFGISKRGNYAKLLNAPIGSTFTATTTEADNFGARVWRHVDPHLSAPWVCVEGEARYKGGGVWLYVTPHDAEFLNGAAAFVTLPTGYPTELVHIPTHLFVRCYDTNRNAVSGWVRFNSGTISYELAAGVVDHWAAFFTVTHYRRVTAAWPSADTYTAGGVDWVRTVYRSLDELRELIAEIESDPDHEHHESLQQLRDELAELEGQSDA